MTHSSRRRPDKLEPPAFLRAIENTSRRRWRNRPAPPTKAPGHTDADWPGDCGTPPRRPGRRNFEVRLPTNRATTPPVRNDYARPRRRRRDHQPAKSWKNIGRLDRFCVALVEAKHLEVRPDPNMTTPETAASERPNPRNPPAQPTDDRRSPDKHATPPG